MNYFLTHAPVVKAVEFDFVEKIKVGRGYEWVPFKEKVLWLLESKSDLRMKHGGREVKKLTSFSDFYGYLTSICAQDAEQTAAAYGVNTSSSLIVELETLLGLSPVIMTESDIEFNNRKSQDEKARYSFIPDSWKVAGSADTLEHCTELYERVIAKQCVWSSKRSKRENSCLLKKIKRDWSVEQIPSLFEIERLIASH